MISIKSISKSEFAAILGVCSATVCRILNKELIDKIEPLGYIKNNRIIRGKVLEYIKQEMCITDADIEAIKKKS